jgi:hypothetical protein
MMVTALAVPAHACLPVTGQDYTTVPTRRPTAWALQVLPGARLVVHDTGSCWVVLPGGRGTRTVDLAGDRAAHHAGATLCG